MSPSRREELTTRCGGIFFKGRDLGINFEAEMKDIETAPKRRHNKASVKIEKFNKKFEALVKHTPN